MSWWNFTFTFGTSSSDVITGGSLNDFIFGLKGDDFLYGGGGDDFLFGGKGDDWLYGGEGDDFLKGGKGDDWLFGQTGNDMAIGGSSDDRLYGGVGSDFLIGNSGNDLAKGGEGTDVLLLGSGNDYGVYDIRSNLDNSGCGDFYLGSGGTDTVVLTVDQLIVDAFTAAGVDIFALTSTYDAHHKFDFASLNLTTLDADAGNDFTLFTIGFENLIINYNPILGDDALNVSLIQPSSTIDLFANDDDLDDSAMSGHSIIPDNLILSGEEFVIVNVDITVLPAGFSAIRIGMDVGDIAKFKISTDPSDNMIPAAILTVTMDGNATIEHNGVFSSGDVIDFEYMVDDGLGGMGTASGTFLMNSPPDAVDDMVMTDEDNPVLIDVLGNDMDPDGDPITITQITSPPAKGIAAIVAGKIEFDPNGEFEDLDEGDVEFVTFEYEITDGQGEFDTALVTVKVTGVNDDPVAFAAVENVDEGDPGIVGQLVATDVDDGAMLTFSLVNAAPAGFMLNPDGSYSFDPTDPAYDHLAVGALEVLSIDYNVDDGLGGMDQSTLTINVTGTNDDPIAQAAVENVDEGDPGIVGQLVVTDVDDGAMLTFSLVAAAPAGFMLNPDGSYSFDPTDPAYDHLAAGALEVLSIDYNVDDGLGGMDQSTLTINVTGTNDDPIAQAAVENVDEGDPGIVGQLVATDVDDGAMLTFSLVAAAPAGFMLNPDGSYSFDPTDPAYDHLAAGALEVLSIDYNVDDGLGGMDQSTLTINVTGTNDDPIAQATVENVDEGDPGIVGQLVATDVDDGAMLMFSLVAAAPAGFMLNPDGSYSFDPTDPAYDHLAAGVLDILSIDYNVDDGLGGMDQSTLTINVTGTNDDPIAQAAVENVDEGDPGIVGQLVVTDVDDGAMLTFSLVAAAPAGFMLNPDGSYSFDPTDPAYDHLAAGALEVLSIDYNVDDGLGGMDQSTLTINVTGTNDDPIAQAAVENVDEGDPGIVGQLVATDVDDGAMLTFSLVNPAPAGFMLNPDGSYSFDPTDAAYDHLAAGALEVLSIDYNVDDGLGGMDQSTLTINVTGTNDDPIAQAAVENVDEGDPGIVGQLVATDVDDGAMLTFSLVNPAPAGFMLNPDGSYSFDPTDAAYDHLAAGALEVLSIDYNVDDGLGGMDQSTLTINVTGTNDDPIAQAAVENVDEGDPGIVGQLVATDVDDGAMLTFSLVNPAPAGFMLNPDGSYSFDPTDAAYDHLAAGALEVLSIDYNVDDGLGGMDQSTLTINVTGTNDAPVAVDDEFMVTEDEVFITNYIGGNILSNDTDVDNAALDLSVVPDTVLGSVGGTLELFADGTFDYFATDPLIDALNVGDFYEETFNYLVSDGSAGDFGQIKFIISGVNDAPIAFNDMAMIDEDAMPNTVVGNVLANDTDVDNVLADFSVTTDGIYSGLYGELELLTDGSYTYTLDNADSAVDELNDGETLMDVFAYTMIDGALSDGAAITITINGNTDLLSLFTDNNDTVDFNTINVADYDTSQFYYHAGDGNDIVALPDPVNFITAGFDNSTLFSAGDGDDTVLLSGSSSTTTYNIDLGASTDVFDAGLFEFGELNITGDQFDSALNILADFATVNINGNLGDPDFGSVHFTDARSAIITISNLTGNATFGDDAARINGSVTMGDVAGDVAFGTNAAASMGSISIGNIGGDATFSHAVAQNSGLVTMGNAAGNVTFGKAAARDNGSITMGDVGGDATFDDNAAEQGALIMGEIGGSILFGEDVGIAGGSITVGNVAGAATFGNNAARDNGSIIMGEIGGSITFGEAAGAVDGLVTMGDITGSVTFDRNAGAADGSVVMGDVGGDAAFGTNAAVSMGSISIGNIGGDAVFDSNAARAGGTIAIGLAEGMVTFGAGAAEIGGLIDIIGSSSDNVFAFGSDIGGQLTGFAADIRIDGGDGHDIFTISDSIDFSMTLTEFAEVFGGLISGDAQVGIDLDNMEEVTSNADGGAYSFTFDNTAVLGATDSDKVLYVTDNDALNNDTVNLIKDAATDSVFYVGTEVFNSSTYHIYEFKDVADAVLSTIKIEDGIAVSIAGVLFTPGPGGVIIMVSPDGTVTETQPDGTVTETAVDGSTLVTAPDGSTVATAADGTVTETAVDGSTLVTAADGSTIATAADGSMVATAADGTVTETAVDGSTLVTAPDGSTVATAADGSMVATAADGTVTETAVDGSTLVTAADGSMVATAADGSMVATAADGTVTETAVDGSTLVTAADGSTLATAADGSTVATAADGSMVATAADGTVTETAVDGSTLVTAADGSTLATAADGSMVATAADGTVTETAVDGSTLVTAADGSMVATAADGSMVATAADGSTLATAADEDSAVIGVGGAATGVDSSAGVAEIVNFSLASDFGDSAVSDFSIADGDTLMFEDVVDSEPNGIFDAADLDAVATVSDDGADVSIDFNSGDAAGASINVNGLASEIGGAAGSLNSFADLEAAGVNLDIVG